MTTNEREAFERDYSAFNECAILHRDEDDNYTGLFAKEAWAMYQAGIKYRISIDQQQEVTYSTLDTIVELACQFKNDEIETVDEFGTRLHAALQSIALPKSGEVVVTKNEADQIVAVTRQDGDGRVLEVIAESIAKPVKVPAKKEPNGDVYIHGWNSCVEAFLAANPWYKL